MKRSLRSLLAGVLAMTMVIGMSVTTFAATLPAEYCIPVIMYDGSIEKWKKEELHTVSLAGGEEYTVWIVSTYNSEHDNYTSYGYLYTDGDGNYYLGGSSDKETVIWSFTDDEFGLGATRSAVEEKIKGIGQTKCGKDCYLFGWFGETGPEPTKPSSKPIPSPKKNMKLDKEDAVEMEMRVANVAVDKDTFKSEAPAKTIMSTDTMGADKFLDLKVHAADERTKLNQQFLCNALVRPNAQILLTENVYSRRDLSIAENGSLQTLTWNNLPKNQPGPVYAVVYNQIDGAYEINGILDANGTATFTGFKLRPASTITICK